MIVHKLAKKSEARVMVNYWTGLNIQSYGVNNLYPEDFRQVVLGSSIATECVERLSEFIEGNGIYDEKLAELTVNHLGDTMDDITQMIAQDLALWKGFALHLNYNVHGQITEIQYVPFEHCRLEETNDQGKVEHIVLHPDWTGRKTIGGNPYPVDEEHIKRIDVFNPDPAEVKKQIRKAGGINSYKGQVLWCSMAGRDLYPLGVGDRCATEMSTDEGLSNVKHRNVRNNFLPAAMIITKQGSATDYAEDNDIEVEEAEKELKEQQKEFSSALEDLQGDYNVGKFIEVTVADDEEIPEIKPFEIKNYDKDFAVTEASVVSRIYSSFGQEVFYCIKVGKGGFGIDMLSAAFANYNSVVAKYQRFISRAYKRIFEYYDKSFKDFSIEPIKYVSNETNTAPTGGGQTE